MDPDIRLKSPKGRWVLVATVLGSGVALVDATIVNVALPRIGRDFHASLADLQWMVNAYTLTLAGLILLGGSLGDRYGRRRVFVIGVIWFAAASALCAAAPITQMLIAARALQGIGGALLTPGSLAIIQASFAPGDRSRAVGAWSGLGGVAGAIGPFLGGWLVSTAGWRWVFLMNLPLAAVVVAVALRHVPEIQGRDRAWPVRRARGGAHRARADRGDVRADRGAAAGLEGGAVRRGGAGRGLRGGFVPIERTRTRAGDPEPMLPLDVFASRQFTAVNVVTFVVYGGMSVVFFLFVVICRSSPDSPRSPRGRRWCPSTILMLLLSARVGRAGPADRPADPDDGRTGGGRLGMLLMTRIGPHAS